MPRDPHEKAIGRSELVAAHRPDAIRRRLQQGRRESYLKDFVYGAIDGGVTTFAVVSGVAGAGLSPGVVIVLGVANLIGDGFSMAAGNFLGTQAERQQHDRLRGMEERHVREFPEGEREEIRQIFAASGFTGPDLDRAVAVITSDPARWVDTMLREEHGLPLTKPSPIAAAAMTFCAFLSVGALPLIPFLLGLASGVQVAEPFLWSSLMTAAAFFAVGAVKSRFVDQSWLRSGLLTVFVGGVAASLSYACGLLLRGIVH